MKNLIAVVPLLFLVACGGGGSGGAAGGASEGAGAPPSTPTTPAPSTRQLAGQATKAPLRGAQVSVSSISGEGGPLQLLASTTTNNDGAFTTDIAGAGTVLVEVTGGSYFDEADPEADGDRQRQITLPAGRGLSALVPGDINRFAVTLLSQQITDRSLVEAAQGGDLNTLFSNARAQATAAFGFDVLTTIPANPTDPAPGSSAAELQYAMVLGGLAQALNTLALSTGRGQPDADLLDALASDLSDGRLDGLRFGAAITIDGGQTLPVDVDFNDEILRFRNNNFEAYAGVSLAFVDQGILAQPLGGDGNTAPVAADDDYTVARGATLEVAAPGVLLNDSDAERRILQLELVSGPAAGTLQLNANGSFEYVHNGSRTALDQFTYRITDPGGLTDSATVRLTIEGIEAVPVAVDDSDSTAANTPVVIAVLDNDNGPLDATTVELVSAAGNGAAEPQANGTIQYTPGSNFLGADSFTYRVSNSQRDFSAAARVTVTVVNSSPASNDVNVELAEDENAAVLLSGTDSDDGVAGFVLLSVPANGGLFADAGFSQRLAANDRVPASNSAATVFYVPASDFNGSDAFAFEALDGFDAGSGPATASLTVTPVNDEPVVSVNTLGAVEGQSSAVTSDVLSAVDVDNPDAELVYTLRTQPRNGAITLRGNPLPTGAGFAQQDVADGNVAYRHDGSETSDDDLPLELSDGASEQSVDVPVTVAPVNDQPEFFTTEQTLAEGATLVLPVVALDGRDADTTPGQLSYRVTALPFNGDLLLDSDPLGTGGQFSQQAVSDGRVSYRHNGSETDTDQLDLQLSDGSSEIGAQLLFNIISVNDAPTLRVTAIAVDEGATVAVAAANLAAEDADNLADELVFTLQTAPTNGNLLLSGNSLTNGGVFTQTDVNDGLLAYRHGGGENSSDGFVVVISDGELSTDPTTVEVNVGGANDAPQLATGPLAVGEGGTTVINAAVLAATDADNAANELTFTLDTPPTSGDVLLGSTALVAGNTFTQADVDAGSVSYRHGGNEPSAESFTVTVRDPGALAATGSVVVTITAVNDAPVLQLQNVSLDEGAAATLNSSAIATTDPDTAPADLQYTVTTAPSNGQLLLDGTPLGQNDGFTQADVDANALTYQHSGSESTADGVGLSVSDGALSDAGTLTLTIIPVNDAPVLANGSFSVIEGGNVQVGPAVLNGSDPDNTPAQLQYSLNAAPQNGQLLNGSSSLGAGSQFTQADVISGAISYQHDGGEFSSDGFSVSLSDGTLSTSASVTISVGELNDPPTLTTNELQLDEDATAIVGSSVLLAQDNDTAADQLQFTVVTTPAQGELLLGGVPLGSAGFSQQDINEGRLSYRHGGGETDSDNFSVQVSDGDQSASGTVQISIEPINDAPVLTANPLTLDEAATAVITAAELSTADPDNTPEQLIYSIDSLPATGQLLLNGAVLGGSGSFTQADIVAGRLAYRHDGNETTADSIALTVSDGLLDDNDSLTIVINSVNDGPTLQAGLLDVPEDGTTVIPATVLMATDPDNAPAELIYSILTAPVEGTLLLNGQPLSSTDNFTEADVDAGRLAYRHDGNESVADSIELSVSDGALSAEATLNIRIGANNDAPVLTTGGLVVDEGAVTTITSAALSASDSDNAPAELVYTIDSTPENGAVELSEQPLTANGTFTQADIDNGLLVYRHDGSETVDDGFTVTVSDGSLSDQGSVAITVLPVNDGPSLNAGVVNVDEAGTVTVPMAALNTVDPDNAPGELVFTIDTAPVNGTLLAGMVELGRGSTFSQAAVNGGLVAYRHDGSETTTDSIALTVSDGDLTDSGVLEVRIGANNDAPVLTIGSLTLDEGAEAILDDAALQASDDDNMPEQLLYTLMMTPINGQLRLDDNALLTGGNFTQQDIDDGLVTYRHNGGENTSDSLEVMISDGVENDRGTLLITINPVNDAPTVVSNPLAVVEGAFRLLTMAQLNATDPDNAASELIYSIGTAAVNGQLERNAVPLAANDSFTQQDIADGLIGYRHDGSETSSDSVLLSLTDGIETVPVTLTINVIADNDAPVLTAGTLNALEGTESLIGRDALEATDSDNVPAELQYSVTTAPAVGELLLGGVTSLTVGSQFTQADIDNDALSYRHDGSESTADSFAVTVTDGTDSVSGSVDIVIAPVNDPPQLLLITQTLVEGATLTLDRGAIDTRDPDTDPADLLLTLTTTPLNGDLLLDGTPVLVDGEFSQQAVDGGRVSYRHNGSDTTSDQLVLAVTDGEFDDSGTLRFVVQPVNDAPTLVLAPFAVDEGGTVTLTAATLNASDPDNADEALFYMLTAFPADGVFLLQTTPLGIGDRFNQADVAAGNVSYRQDGSEPTVDPGQYSFSLNDGNASVSDSSTITVNPVNDDPSLTTGGLGVNEGDVATVTPAVLAASDSDNTPAERVYTLTAVPTEGDLIITDTSEPLVNGDTFTQQDVINGALIYSHRGGNGTDDSFSVSLTDGGGNSVTGTVNIDVNPVNDPPTLALNGLTIAEGATQPVGTANVQATDSDNTPAELLFTLTQLPVNGQLLFDGSALAQNGQFTQADINSNLLSYRHLGGENVSDSLGLQVSDGSLSDGGVLNITVTPVNDPPVLMLNPLTLDEGATVPVTNATINAQDPDDVPANLLFSVTEIGPTGGFLLSGTPTSGFSQADINAGRLSYRHDGSETGNDSIELLVSDGDDSASGLLTVVVNPVNDAPTIVVGSTRVDEGARLVLGTGNLQAVDPDNTAAELTFTVTAAPIRGSLTLADAPLVRDDTFSQADITAGRLAYVHDGSETIGDSVGLRLSDGAANTTGTLNIDITPVDDPPTLTLTPPTLAEGDTLDLVNNIIASDPDTAAVDLQFRLTALPDSGSVTLSGTALTANGNFTQADLNNGLLAYAHDGSETTSDSFSVSVSDGGPVVSGTLSLTITAVNDAPELTITNPTVDEGGLSETDSVGLGEVLAVVDTDNGNDELIYTLTAAPANGNIFGDDVDPLPGDATFTHAEVIAGQFAYRHDGSETTTDQFSLSLTDGSDTVLGTVNVTINPLNDRPVFQTVTLAVNEGLSATVTTSNLNATDPDHTAAELTYTIDSAPANGQISRSRTSLGQGSSFTQTEVDAGSISYQHDGSETTSDTLAITVRDSSGAPATGTLSIAINPVNDNPVLTLNTLTVDEGARAIVLPTNVSTADPDNAPADFVYVLTRVPADGALGRVDEGPLAVGARFTDDEINSGLIEYIHGGGENATDSLEITVFDGDPADSATGSDSGDLNISVTGVNDAPALRTNAGLDAANGRNTAISADNLLAEDVDNTAAQLLYTVITDSACGIFTLPNGNTTTFTQANIDAGDVGFFATGCAAGEQSPVQLQLTDGSDGFGPFDFQIRALGLRVVTVQPAQGQEAATANTNISADFVDGDGQVAELEASSVNSDSVAFHRSLAGRQSDLAFDLSVPGQLRADPAAVLLPNEVVEVTYTPAIQSTSGLIADAFVSRFRVAAAGNGVGEFTAHPQTPRFGGGDAAVLATGDIDGDGDIDVALGSGPGTGSIWLNDGAGNYTAFAGANDWNVADITSLVLADIDSDGDLDAFLATASSDLHIFVNDGTGVFTAHPGTPIVEGRGAGDSDVVLGDLDGDGDLDAVVSTFFAGEFILSDVYLNDGSGAYTPTPLDQASATVGRAVALADINQDGSLDIIIGRMGAGTLVAFNNGNAVFEETVLLQTEAIDIIVADFNGDGFADVAALRNGDEVDPEGEIHMLFNDGAGAIIDVVNHFNVGDYGSFKAGDVDADGDLDFLLTGGGLPTVVVFNRLNEMPGGLFVGTEIGFSGAHDAASLVDIDGDGDLDFVTTDASQAGGDAISDEFSDGQEEVNSTEPRKATDAGENVLVIEVPFGGGQSVWLNNRPPLAQADALSTDEDIDLSADLFANNGSGPDADADGDAFTVSAVNGQAALVGEGSTLEGGSTLFVLLDGSMTLQPGDDFQSLGSGESDSEIFNYTIADGNGGESTATVTVTITGVNDPISLVTGDLAVIEGGGANVGTAQLNSSDPDTAAANRIYTLTSEPTQGILFVNSVPPQFLSMGDTFTQATVDAGGIDYSHNGGEGPSDSFSVSVTDNEFSATGTVNINVTGVDDEPPTLVLNTLNVDEGGSVVVMPANVMANDVDTAPENLLFDITEIGPFGEFRLSGVATLGFTQADINALRVSYVHFGGEDTGNSVELSVTDGGGNSDSDLLQITVNPINDPPVITTGSATLDEDAEQVLDSTVISATDTEDDDATLRFTLTRVPANGLIRRSGDSIIGAGETFTQQEVIDGRISYDHDGSETASDNFVLQVSDSGRLTASGTVTLTITPVNDQPRLLRNIALTVDDAATVSVTPALNGDDAETGPAGLTYRVISTTNVTGRFLVGGSPVGSFTQANLDAGTVSFQHTQSPATTESESISMQLDDGNGGTVPFSLIILVNISAPDFVRRSTGSPVTGGEPQGSGDSFGPRVAGNGNFVAFQSRSPEFGPGSDQVYVKNLTSLTLQQVTLNDAGEPANFGSTAPDLSHDGRYVVYSSAANNLVSGVEIPVGSTQIYRYDRQLGTTTLVSADSRDGVRANDDRSIQPRIAADGRVVVFTAFGNVLPGNSGTFNVYAWFPDTQKVVLVSAAADGTPATRGAVSQTPSISANGRFVAFISSAQNLVAGLRDGLTHVYVKDLETGGIERISATSNAQSNTPANGDSSSPEISLNGQLVAFISEANNLAQLGGVPLGQPNVYLKNRGNSLVSRVNVAPTGNIRIEVNSGDRLALAPNALAFPSLGSNAPQQNSNRVADIFVKLVSVPLVEGNDLGDLERLHTSGNQTANGNSLEPSLSNDGALVVLASDAGNLVPEDSNGRRDIFSRDNPLFLANNRDSDGDGINDAEEDRDGTNPFLIDSDFDGLTDPDELNVHRTDPTTGDTDKDDVGDGVEIAVGSDPNQMNTTVIHIAPGGTGNGSSWDSPLGSNASLSSILGNGGMSATDPTFVLYEAGTYDPLDLRFTEQNYRHVIFQGSVGSNIWIPRGVATTFRGNRNVFIEIPEPVAAMAVFDNVHLRHIRFTDGVSRDTTSGAGIDLYIFSTAGSAFLTNVEVVDNIGPGVVSSGLNLTIADSVVSENGLRPESAEIAGAGIRFDSGSLTIRDSVIAANTSREDGGGLLLRGTGSRDATLINTKVLHNIANSIDGGAGISAVGSTLSIVNGLFMGNATPFDTAEGGAIASRGVDGSGDALLLLDKSTLVYNQAQESGSGLSHENINRAAPVPRLIDNIVFFNENTQGSVTFADQIINAQGYAASGFNNVQGARDGGTGSGSIDVLPGFLADFRLDQRGPSVEVGSENAVGSAVEGLSTSIDGGADRGRVDLGFHHNGATVFPQDIVDVNPSVFVPFNEGARLEFRLGRIDICDDLIPLVAGHLVTARILDPNPIPDGVSLVSATRIDPTNDGSVIAVDNGLGLYRVGIESGRQDVSVTLRISIGTVLNPEAQFDIDFDVTFQRGSP